MASTISGQALKTLIDSETLYAVIDVRDWGEFSLGQIPGASCIPRGSLEKYISVLVPKTDVHTVLYCDTGQRSTRAAASLETLGYAPSLRRLISEELPDDRVVQIEYERDMPSLYAMMDVLLHVPINPEIEAFGQIYVEAMAAGIPSVVTLSGIAHEYIVDGENAVVVSHDSAEAILAGLMRLDDDPALRVRLVENGRRSVRDRFALDRQMRELASLYERWCA